MISDILDDAITQLDDYLGSLFANIYSSEMRQRLLALRAEMDTIRRDLHASGIERYDRSPRR